MCLNFCNNPKGFLSHIKHNRNQAVKNVFSQSPYSALLIYDHICKYTIYALSIEGIDKQSVFWLNRNIFLQASSQKPLKNKESPKKKRFLFVKSKLLAGDIFCGTWKVKVRIVGNVLESYNISATVHRACSGLLHHSACSMPEQQWYLWAQGFLQPLIKERIEKLPSRPNPENNVLIQCIL